jgi:hypothetical protein
MELPMKYTYKHNHQHNKLLKEFQRVKKKLYGFSTNHLKRNKPIREFQRVKKNLYDFFIDHFTWNHR